MCCNRTTLPCLRKPATEPLLSSPSVTPQGICLNENLDFDGSSPLLDEQVPLNQLLLETTIIRDNRLPAHPLPFQAVRCEKAFVRLHRDNKTKSCFPFVQLGVLRG